MNLEELSIKALKVRQLYAENEIKQGQKQWGNVELAAGFTADVGKLMKLVMAKEGFRDIKDVDKLIGHELADCLYCCLILANHYGINLEKSFFDTMNELEDKIKVDI